MNINNDLFQNLDGKPEFIACQGIYLNSSSKITQQTYLFFIDLNNTCSDK